MHRWTFIRAGGNDQVCIASAADLLALAQLDQKLWTALACPVEGLELDPVTLRAIDSDGDGRIRAPELLAAIAWVAERLADPSVLLQPGDRIPVQAIGGADPGAQAVAAAARRIAAGAREIGLAQILAEIASVSAEPFNGDGIVPAAACAASEAKALVEAAVASGFAVADRGGDLGVGTEQLDALIAAARARKAWLVRADVEPAILLLGAATAAACDALVAVEARIDDWFARSALLAYDSRLGAALEAAGCDPAQIAGAALSRDAHEAARLPLARPGGDGLPLTAGINPAWSVQLDVFVRLAVGPLLGGRTRLLHRDWDDLRQRFADYRAWLAAEPAAALGVLAPARLDAIAAGAGAEALRSLIAQDTARTAEVAVLAELERLVRLRRDLLTLTRNFVNFADFYDQAQRAVFEAGTLHLDGRTFSLCIRVQDKSTHAQLAVHSRCCLLYCDLSRLGERRSIVVAVTNGDSETMAVGRNGVFYDRLGQDWDATVAKLIDHPVSVRQAFFDPYKRIINFIESLAFKRAAAADAGAVGAVQGVAAAPPADPPKMDVGTVAAIGVAVGGITAALGAMLQAFFGLGLWMPLGVIALVLIISGPSMAIAWWKLRSRVLGPLLDASGWAVNTRVKITIPLGRQLTQLPRLPDDAVRIGGDRFAENRFPWRRILVLVVLLAVLAALAWHHFFSMHDTYFWVGPRLP